MLRLIVFVCVLHLSVGGIIRGRILLDGDANKYDRVPAGSKLTVYFQDTSLMDTAATNIKQLKIADLIGFPFSYEIEIPSDLSPAKRYSLSVRITQGEHLLFINDYHIPVTVGSDTPIIKDIHVIGVNRESRSVKEEMPPPPPEMKQLSWPEMVGKEGTYAVEYIKEKSGLTSVFTFPENSAMTMDYRSDRVRVIINAKGIVVAVPRTG